MKPSTWFAGPPRRGLLLALAWILAPARADAGPASCAKALLGCGEGTVASAQAIKKSRATCEALRDCKEVCREDAREDRGEARDTVKVCKDACGEGGKKGAEKRACEDRCQDQKKAEKKEVRGLRAGCMDTCRDQYKTPACVAARREMALTLTKEGLSCAAAVSAACPAPAP